MPINRTNKCAPDLPLCLPRSLAAEVDEVRAHRSASPFAARNAMAIRREARDAGTYERPAYVRDAEKIIHMPAYNRLAGKTQVFSFHANDDISRRGLHVQLVSRVARDIGQSLGLNLDLIEAMALGHDIGHTPFGHAGERFLNDCYHERTGRYFMHNVQSVRVLDVLYGRNLCMQTLDGVICHNGEFEQQRFETSGLDNFADFDAMVQSCWEKGPEAGKHLRPATMEGCVVRISDIIAYVGKDRQDAIIAHIADEDTFKDGLGSAYNTWALSAFITDVVANSFGKSQICMSEEAFAELSRAKRENYDKIYLSSEVNGEFSDTTSTLFHDLYEHELATLEAGNEDSAIFRHHIRPVSRQLANYGRTYDWQRDLDLTVVDYISSMTDQYFMDTCARLFPEAAKVFPYHGYFDGLGA